MEKKVLNAEAMQKKQQKQFSIGLCVGFMLFIFFIIFVESDFLRNKINVDSNLLKTPNIINLDDDKDKGKQLEELNKDYKLFIETIDNLNLDSLEDEEFLREGDNYQYVDENYTYITNDNYLKLTRKNADVYSVIVEEDIKRIELYSEKTYILEYSSNNISFKVNDKTYKISINSNQYFLECDYTVNNYVVNKEIYDSEWNFVNISLLINENDYTGYFMEDLSGYSLSDDKLEIKKDTGESMASTMYLEDNTTLYYTIISYEFNESKTKDVLIVNNTQDFPLK